MSSPTSDAPAGRKVGLLFGSFNPIHTGHLILANFLATHTDLAEVWLIISPQSPFKAEADLLDEQARLALVTRAIAGNARLRVLDLEFRMPKPSYTIDTLDALRQLHPGQEFVLLMGGDNLPGLPRWKAADLLLTEYEIYVYPRPGYDLPAPLPPAVRVVEAPLLDISATFIRRCLREGLSVRYLLPEVVEEQIRQQGYYS